MKKEVPVHDGLRQLPIRPVYLVSVEHKGKKNIISIGMFAFFSGKPTLVGVGITRARYSFELVRQSGEYVVNVVDAELMKAALIQESPVSIECKVVKEVEIGDHVWFMGEVVAVHVREGYNWKDGLLFKWIGEDGFYYEVGEKVGEF
jgi:flavin reductase (DIM6/NTAB) family NADH-FMN oxidoreductase RutF